MLGFISKKKLTKIINELYWCHDDNKSDGTITGDKNNDYYYNCGCANICNYISDKFKLPEPRLNKPQK